MDAQEGGIPPMTFRSGLVTKVAIRREELMEGGGEDTRNRCIATMFIEQELAAAKEGIDGMLLLKAIELYLRETTECAFTTP